MGKVRNSIFTGLTTLLIGGIVKTSNEVQYQEDLVEKAREEYEATLSRGNPFEYVTQNYAPQKNNNYRNE